jgi:hypothetical protein
VIVDESFAHSWQVEVLERRPLIVPSRQFVYPRDAEEVERGAMELLVRPQKGLPFLATCALGFADALVPSGVWASPNPDVVCAVAGGYAYWIDTADPSRFEQISFRPVLLVRPVVEHKLLLFGGHHSLEAWGSGGCRWQSPRLSWEGFEIMEISGDLLHGTGWDMMTDINVTFTVDLKTGETI